MALAPLPVLPGLGDTVQAAFTPTQQYATDPAIKAQRDYAKALMYGTQGNAGRQFPVVQSWTQGVSNMVNALLGGNDAHNAEQREQAALSTAKGPPPSFSEGPTSEGHEEKSDGGSEIERAAKITSSQESGGNYNAVGNRTRTGDRAYGKYQVMGENIPEWTQAALGKAMTPDEFLRNPEAQEAVYKAKMGEYLQKYGSNAGKAWFAGEKGMNNPNARDVNGMTVARYGDAFARGMGSPSAPAMAFTGPDAGSQAAPAVQAMSNALRGDNSQVAENTQVAAGKGAVPQTRTPLPAPAKGPILIDPRLVKAPPIISPGQMNAMMNMPGITPEIRAGYIEQYRNQMNQVVEMPYPGGKVRIDLRNPTAQQFIPDLHYGKVKAGEIEVEKPSVVGPGGAGLQQMPIPSVPIPQTGPRSQATPPVAPTAAPAGTPSPVQAGAGPIAQNAPEAPAAAPQAPVKVASLDPTAGVGTVGAPGAAGTAPPSFPVSETATGVPNNPLAKMAANDGMLKQILGPEVWEMAKQKKEYDQEQAIEQKQREADIDVNKTARTQNYAMAAKRYDNMQAATQAAYSQLDNLKTADRQLKDPNFYSGLFANEVEGIKKLGALFGGDPNSSKPMEVFRKTMSQSIANGLKAAYGGLGQIRNKEIELSEKANGSLSNSLPANLALVEISRRSAQRMAHLGEMGTDYRLGHEVVDPISGKVLVPANVGEEGKLEPRVGLDPGYDKAANEFVKAHPMFSGEEYKNFNTLFDKKAGEAEKGKTGTGEAKSLDELQPGMTYKGFKFKGGDKTDQKNYEKH